MERQVTRFPPFFYVSTFSEKGEQKEAELLFLACREAHSSNSRPLSCTPIFSSYETSNYAAIQVAFHKAQCCPLEHGEAP